MYPQSLGRLTATEVDVLDNRTDEEKLKDRNFDRRFAWAVNALSMRMLTRRQAFDWVFKNEEPKYYEAQDVS